MIRAITSFKQNYTSTNFKAKPMPRANPAESARLRAGIEKFISRDGGNKLVDTRYAAWKAKQAAQQQSTTSTR